MKEKNRSKLHTFIALFVSALLCLTVYFTGYAVRERIASGSLYLRISFFTLAALCLLNLSAVFIYHRRQKQRDFGSFLKDMAKAEQSTVENTKKAQYSLRGIRALIFLCLSLLVVLSLSFSFFAGTVLINYDEFLWLNAIPFVVIGGVAEIFLSRFHSYEYPSTASRSDYPTIYGIAEKAQAACNVKGRIIVELLPVCNAGIQRFGNVCHVQLGAVLLSIVNEDELYAVLLHEFAHLSDKYHKEYNANRAMSDAFEDGTVGLFGKIVRTLFISFLGEYFIDKNEIMSDALQKAYERRADIVSASLGNPSAAVSSLEKIHWYHVFDDEVSRYLPNFFESETLKSDTVSTLCRVFREQFAVRKDFWHSLAENELPLINSTHPIFRERRQSMGDPKYTVDLPNEDTPLSRESEKAVVEADRIKYNIDMISYESDRREFYTEPLKIVDEWHRDGCDMQPHKIDPVIKALYLLQRNDEAEELADKIISEYGECAQSAYALFAKGLLMFKRDKNGSDFLFKSMELNRNFVERSLYLLNNFCAKLGLRSDMERFKEAVSGLMKNAAEHDDIFSELKRGDKIEPNSLPDTVKKEIVNIAEEHSNKVERVYAVKKHTSESQPFHIIIMKFAVADPDNDDACSEALEKMFNYLDSIDGEYYLSEYGQCRHEEFDGKEGYVLYENVQVVNGEK